MPPSPPLRPQLVATAPRPPRRPRTASRCSARRSSRSCMPCSPRRPARSPACFSSSVCPRCSSCWRIPSRSRARSRRPWPCSRPAVRRPLKGLQRSTDLQCYGAAGTLADSGEVTTIMVCVCYQFSWW
eukprot:Mycagemm_TRINITY_DN10073_c0_g2::TRINITY_DN10073_c0_g2_i1::g.2261::m.2261 type:complete len:128 gc:universal TRINITY_DN10073_c0_g2_i1:927-1310(+)